ncbi:hypothetical protein ACDX78_13625 [Virgibacillus oceani]
MNTLTHAPILQQTRMRDNEFILDDLEFTFPKQQLKQITDDWNAGMDVEFVAKKNKRNAHEVFLALYHQARKGKVKRPFAYRGL